MGTSEKRHKHKHHKHKKHSKKHKKEKKRSVRDRAPASGLGMMLSHDERHKDKVKEPRKACHLSPELLPAAILWTKTMVEGTPQPSPEVLQLWFEKMSSPKKPRLPDDGFRLDDATVEERGVRAA